MEIRRFRLLLTMLLAPWAMASPAMSATAPAHDPAGPGYSSPWWVSMGDPLLADLVARALAGNLDIEQAAARFQRADAAAGAARAALLPQVGAGASAAAVRQSLEDPAIRPFASQPGFPRDVERYEAGLTASWEIDLFGSAPRRQAARAGVAAAAADLAGVRVAVAAETATVWYNLLELQARKSIAEQRLANLQRQTVALEQRADAGVVARIDADRIDAETRAAAAAVPRLSALATVETERLGVLINDSAHARALASRLPPVPPMPMAATVATFPVTLADRPDVIAAARRLQAAGAGVAATRAQRLPRVQLGALIASIASAPAALFTAPALAAQASAGLAMPLFDFGRIDAAIADARGAERGALAAYRQALLLASADVESAAATLAARQQEAQLQQQAARSAGRASAAAAATFDGGASDLTAYLDAERSLFAATEAHTVANADAARARVALSRATATWDDRQPMDPN